LERFQGLAVGEQLAVVTLVITILLAVLGGIRWWIDRRDRLAREQENFRAKQANFAFTRSTHEDPIGVGSWGANGILLGELYSVGIANAARVSLRAFLNGQELPHHGSWPREQALRVGDWLNYRFLLPFRVEPRDQEEGQQLDDPLTNAVVRFDVQFTDTSAANRVLSYCFRFDRAPLPQRWLSRQIDCEN
jgi:hypothetical protein